MSEPEGFLSALRSALNHLYDPSYLRKSPLAGLFGLPDAPDTYAALQRILTDGIAALEPVEEGAAKPAAEEERRGFELLTYRYIQQFGQEEVAAQLGLSVRHLRRAQNAAIIRLGAALWEHHHLGAQPMALPPVESLLESDDPAPTDPLDWLRGAPLEEGAALDDVLPGVLAISRPLADRHAAALDAAPAASLPPLAVQPVALRQMLLNILTALLATCEGGRLELSAAEAGREVEITFRDGGSPASDTVTPAGLTREGEECLVMAERIAALCGGRLERDAGSAVVTLRLPVLRPFHLLVIDDNSDFLQLIRRELTGAAYQVSGARDPLDGLRLAETHQPDAILLDVMMPRVDGWEILGRLRSHPRTAHIPVVICTILPQEELAKSLGARGFLRKPITREKLLEVVEQIKEIAQ